METTMNRLNIKSAISALAVVMTIALSYFTITWMTPGWSFPAFGILGFRLSNALRGLALITPAAPFGLALGGMMANMADGRFFLGGFSILSMGQLVFGTAIYLLSRRTKSEVGKVALLLAFGIGMGCLQVINLKLIIHSSAVLSTLFIVKVATESISTVIGYPLYRIFKNRK